jgi:hypothetical protein
MEKRCSEIGNNGTYWKSVPQGSSGLPHLIYAGPILLPNGKVAISKWSYYSDGRPQELEPLIADGDTSIEVGLPSPLSWDDWDTGHGGILCAVSDKAYAFMGSYTFPTQDPYNHFFSSFIFHDNTYDAFLMPSLVPANIRTRHEEIFFPSRAGSSMQILEGCPLWRPFSPWSLGRDSARPSIQEDL